MRNFLVAVTLLLAGCSSIADTKVAQQAVDKFHQFLDAENADAIFDGAAVEFQNASQRKDFKTLINAIHRKLGLIRSTTLQGSFANYDNWSDGQITLQYAMLFEHGDANETFVYRVHGDTAKLTGYTVASMAMMVSGIETAGKPATTNGGEVEAAQATTHKAAREVALKAADAAQRGDFQGAIDNASKAIDLDPKFALAYAIRARATFRLSVRKDASADYDKAIEIEPLLASLLGDRGRYVVVAAPATASAPASNSNLGLHYAMLAQQEVAAGDAGQAAMHATYAIHLQPDLATAFDARASANLIRHDDKSALEDANEAIKLDAKLASAYAHRARAQLDLGGLDQAIADATKAIELDHNLVSAYATRAEAFKRTGDTVKAAADLAHAK